jgi:hypothetical protein
MKINDKYIDCDLMNLYLNKWEENNG